MQVGEFRQRLLDHAGPELPRASLNVAMNHWLKHRLPEEAGISACVDLARLAMRVHKELVAIDGSPDELYTTYTPETSLPSQWILSQVDPWVWFARWQLFRCEDPPFTTYEEAVRWLVQTGNKEEAAWRQKHTRWLRKAEKVKIMGNPKKSFTIRVMANEPVSRRLEKGKRLLDDLWHVTVNRRELPYKTKNESWLPEPEKRSYEYVRETFPDIFAKMFPSGEEHVWSVPVYPGTSLFMLEEISTEIAEITGFSKVDTIAYILSGITPTLTPLVMRPVSREPQGPLADLEYSRIWAVIEVRDPVNINSEQWAEVYRLLRKRFGVKHFNRLTPSDQRLCDLVQELGGIPSHGKKAAFWERVRQRWNSEAAKEQYTGARGLTIRYERILEKLDTHRQEIEEISSENISAP